MKLIFLFTAALLVGAVISNAQQQQVPRNQGTLIINASAEALVSIDGQGAYLVVPTMDLCLDKLSTGYHKITAVVDSQEWSASVEIKAGQTTAITTGIDTVSKKRPTPKTAAKTTATQFRLQQQQYKQELSEEIKKDRLQQQEYYKKEQRARKAQLKREAEEYKRDMAKHKKKRVRRPKVH